ncbi:MAG: hypothetical protein H6939_10815 [Burkholderiales bacterium]|nr:hypothetical protein [Burkholderiales bacterium]
MDVILMIAGALIGWAISHFYYVKALNDPREILKRMLKARKKRGLMN